MLTPVLTRPRLSVGVLVFPFVCGLVFFATSSLARRAGTAWSPQPSWAQAPPPTTLVDAPPSARISECVHEMASGLRYGVLALSDAPRSEVARVEDTVTLRMRGWTLDGAPLAMPDEPARYRVNGLIPGFVTALQLMTVGDRWLLCIPEELAYAGRPHAPQGTLVFDVEVLAIDRATPPTE